MPNPEHLQRINQLRAAVAQERKRVSDLESRVGDKALRDRLALAAATLTELQQSMLGTELLKQKRTLAAEASWLMLVENAFDLAVSYRKSVEEAVAKPRNQNSSSG